MYKNLLVLILVFFVSTGNAQTIERFVITVIENGTPGASSEVKGSILVSSNGSREKSCGISVDFGDSLPSKIMEVPINQQAEFNYKYTKLGVFAVSVKGEKVNRFLNGLTACQGQGIQVVSLLDPVQLDDGSLDIVIMARTKPGRTSTTPYFASNLDGTAKLINTNRPLCLNTTLLKPIVFRNNDVKIANEIYSSQQFGILSGNDLYRQAGLGDIQNNLIDFHEKSLKASGHTNNQQCDSIYGSRNMDSLALMFQRVEVIAVPNWMLQSLKKVRSFSEIQNYAPWITLTVQQAKKLALDSQQKSQQNTQLSSKVSSDFSVLAESNSKEKVGSLIIGYDSMRNRIKSEVLNVCTLVNQDQDGAAVSGYLGQNLNMLMPEMRERYLQAGWTIDKKFNAVFKNINEAFIEISRQPNSCHIFVDFPKNLSMLDVGLKQNKLLTTSLGMLIESSAARDLFSTQRGYADYLAYLFARSISASANELKKGGFNDQVQKAQHDAA